MDRADLPVAPDLGRVHFVGIGGAGMSGIARIMLARGVAVSGCDARDSRALAALRARGAVVQVGHAAEHLAEVDTVVASSAIRPDNSEVERLLCDNTRAREWCGWEPQVSLEEGLRRTSDWVRDNLDRIEAKTYQI